MTDNSILYINIKMLLLGDSNVGKSTFLSKYIKGTIPQTRELTIGVDYAMKKIKIDKQIYKLNVWDTAGQESFRAITKSYYRGSHCAIVFFDISNRTTFENISMWINTYVQYGQPHILIIGTKKDKLRKVQKQEAIDFAKQNNATYLETSIYENNDILLEESIVTLIKTIDPNCYIINKETILLNKNNEKENFCGLCRIQ